MYVDNDDEPQGVKCSECKSFCKCTWEHWQGLGIPRQYFVDKWGWRSKCCSASVYKEKGNEICQNMYSRRV